MPDRCALVASVMTRTGCMQQVFLFVVNGCSSGVLFQCARRPRCRHLRVSAEPLVLAGAFRWQNTRMTRINTRQTVTQRHPRLRHSRSLSYIKSMRVVLVGRTLSSSRAEGGGGGGGCPPGTFPCNSVAKAVAEEGPPKAQTCGPEGTADAAKGRVQIRTTGNWRRAPRDQTTVLPC